MKIKSVNFYIVAVAMCLWMSSLLTGCAEGSRSQIQHVERGQGNSSSEQAAEKQPVKDNPEVKKGLVGVLMTSREDEGARRDGGILQSGLREAGYAVKLLYAGGSSAVQISQIEDTIKAGCSLLIIEPVEGVTLGGALAKAKKAGIPVIGYKDPIGNSKDVTRYVFADDYQAGKTQAEYIAGKLKEKGGDGVWNLEIFSGAPGNKKAVDFYNGLMEGLNPYLRSGEAVVHSGRTSFSQTAVTNRSKELARARMENLLGSYYADGTRLDAVLCADDAMALGVMKGLDMIYSGEWPLIAGQGFSPENIEEIQKDRQAVSVLSGSRQMAEGACELAVSMLEGEQLPDERFFDYEDGGVTTRVLRCAPFAVDKDNYEELLIEGGY